MHIIYEDQWLLLCEKPVGVLSQAGSGTNLPDLLAEYRRAHGEAPEVYPLHRLDRGVGGLMAFAKDSRTAAVLSAAIQQGDFRKEYLAVLHGAPEAKSDTLTDLLYHDPQRNKSYIVQRSRRGVREASLTYTVLRTAETENDTLTLVKALLHTGRTHQVRVQFAGRKMPLWGDRSYGAPEKGDIALWCHHLVFLHPKTEKTLDYTLPPPTVFPWICFTEGGNTP